jgi:hypothetical protein
MIILPADRLSQSRTARHDELREYFCDKDAEATLGPKGWGLTLSWPAGNDRHIDPNLDQGLTWWGGNTSRQAMALATRREGRLLRCLYDTWTLQSWSEWLARQRPGQIHRPTILHVDDHRDLGAPRLFVDGDNWVDPIAAAPCRICDPASVRSAIESGALGMGSFLTPFLHVVRRAEVRHLCQPPKARATLDYHFRPTTERDTLLAPGRERPAVCLDLSATAEIGPGTYRITPNVEAWLENLGDSPILLHIDMDYFNNRYDGDSDWRHRPESFDPPLSRILEKIDEMINALAQHRLLDRLEDVVIAYSPGFFPAEFWREADARLTGGLGTLHG